ncbi:MAG: methyltransferase domain-containing protein [Candidatus Xenobia bacterium]
MPIGVDVNACRICGPGQTMSELLDFGPQPLCNQFLSGADRAEYRHPLRVGLCDSCSVIQLIDPVPPSDMAPRVDWLVYNEPEGHLDELADILQGLPDLPERPTVYGITSKDVSTLQRLERRGFSSELVEPWLELPSRCAGTETVQSLLTPETTTRLARDHGQAHMVVARHLFEHAHDTRQIVRALRHLLLPNGVLVFEIPDCTQSLQSGNVSMLWEEHVLYLTADSFQATLGRLGLRVRKFACFSYPLENALVAIVDFGPVRASTAAGNLQQARQYAEAIKRERIAVQACLRETRATGRGVVLYGAGHLACTWVNLMKVADLVDLVVDDLPAKHGLRLPGTRSVIYGSDVISQRERPLCLLSLSPDSETRVRSRRRELMERGATFASIFPQLPTYLLATSNL